MITSLIGQIILGWLLADFITGAFHWWEDQFGDESWPLIGPWIIAPNRLHHAQPLAFTEHGFIARNGAQIIASSVICASIFLAFGPKIWIISLALGGGLANEVHRFAHRPSAAPKWLRVLQDTGLLQSPKAHAVHHRPPQDRNFCVLTDRLNPILEAIGFWTRAERLFGRARNA